MKKTTSVLLLLFFSLSIQAQDWCGWEFKYEFKLENSDIYNFDKIEVSVNAPFESTTYRSGKINYDKNSSTYSIDLSYGCISCGYEDAKFPPTLYFKIYLSDHFNSVSDISIVIPITFEETDQEASSLNLGTIRINDFIFFNSDFPRFEGIRVKKDGTIYPYKKGEYDYPSTDKLYVLK